MPTLNIKIWWFLTQPSKKVFHWAPKVWSYYLKRVNGIFYVHRRIYCQLESDLLSWFIMTSLQWCSFLRPFTVHRYLEIFLVHFMNVSQWKSKINSTRTFWYNHILGQPFLKFYPLFSRTLLHCADFKKKYQGIIQCRISFEERRLTK